MDQWMDKWKDNGLMGEWMVYGLCAQNYCERDEKIKKNNKPRQDLKFAGPLSVGQSGYKTGLNKGPDFTNLHHMTTWQLIPHKSLYNP